MIVILNILLIRQYTKETTINLDTVEVESALSKKMIYQEVENEILTGKKENNVTHTMDGKRINISDNMGKEHIIENASQLNAINMEIETEDNFSVVNITVENTGPEKNGDFYANVSLLDEEENEIINLGGFINQVESGETTCVTLVATVDLANADNYIISKEGEHND
jgi:hypothetical protein